MYINLNFIGKTCFGTLSHVHVPFVQREVYYNNVSMFWESPLSEVSLYAILQNRDKMDIN